MNVSPLANKKDAVNNTESSTYPLRDLSYAPAQDNASGRRTPSPPTRPRPKKEVNDHQNEESLQPLLEPDTKTRLPPLAGPEVDDLDSNNSETNPRQPGVDDGFFSNGSEDKPNGEDEYPDTDLGRYPAAYPRHPEFPYAPGYEPGVYHFPDYVPNEFGGSDSIPDVNVYQHKKTLAQGIMDLALFSANANQMRYVLESYDRHPYYYLSLVLISLSLLFQIAVGIGLLWNARYNVKDKEQMNLANKINNSTVIGIFLITVINVFVSVFGVANPAPSTPK